ncbi:GNAT family N-acetyltransferase [Kitasatospora sp. NBC_01287]|uniref:GNAT family N-acetyltransferase n=1 Tax=Kitasatospora sp. NBC_01287 TaxID=2903573 RepID=UPI002250EE6E|nr:GNAT family N-acetyltransferase [Kitasatospora sp. NBC_01287]MCX4744689.1 GNAT family N-acetyltransferase [Kitasatospora sp. NBC_01287]
MTTLQQNTLGDFLDDAARGVFPPPDGGVTVVAQPGGRTAGVLAFSAHAVVFTDEDPAWVRAELARITSDPLAAPLGPAFLTAFAARTGRVIGNVDLLTVAGRLTGEPPLPLVEIEDREHPRVVRALAFRDGVRVWTVPGGVLVLGRGVAGRWEAAVEVDPGAQGRGLGRALGISARHLLPEGDVVWAQQAPGNATSVRAFQAAGYRPVGAEVLLSLGQRR